MMTEVATHARGQISKRNKMSAKRSWSLIYQLTDITYIPPTACDQYSIPELMWNPEKLLDNPCEYHTDGFIQEGDKHEGTCSCQCKITKMEKKRGSNRPKTLTLSGLKAGTIFENMRQGIVILSTIWPAPRAATVGKISALVIVKPQATQNTLTKNFVNGHKSGKTPWEFFSKFWDIQADEGSTWYPDKGTHGRHYLFTVSDKSNFFLFGRTKYKEKWCV